MPHIVVVTNGLSALAGCHLELSRLLRLDGHRVTFVCAAAKAERLELQGETAVALDHDRRYERLVAADPRPSLARPAALARWARRRGQLRRDSISADEVRDTIRSLEPDLLVIDVELHTAILATADLGIPRVLAMSFFSVFRSPELPPLHTSLPAPTGPLDRARVQARWHGVRVGSVVARARHRLSRPGMAALASPMRLDTVDPADLRPLARRLGVDLGATTDRAQWLRPFLARDLPVLCYNAAEMDLPHTPSPRLHYVGPLVRLDRAEPALPADAATRWARIVADRAGEGPRRPLVYCTLGTVWSADLDLLRRVLAVFERRPDWDLVLGLGGVLDPAVLDPIPANATVLADAPQLAVLAEADVAVTHGGTGTIREAVRFGVPLVVYSTGHVDQDGNAQRVAHHRLGVVGDPRRHTPSDIERSIERALTDRALGEGVARMQALAAAYDDGAALRRLVADALESVGGVAPR